MVEHTHETDKQLWLEAHHHAPFFTLAPGVMLTEAQRSQAYDLIDRNEQSEQKLRMESKAR